MGLIRRFWILKSFDFNETTGVYFRFNRKRSALVRILPFWNVISVKIDSYTSSPSKLLTDVPQGSVLGPLIYQHWWWNRWGNFCCSKSRSNFWWVFVFWKTHFQYQSNFLRTAKKHYSYSWISLSTRLWKTCSCLHFFPLRQLQFTSCWSSSYETPASCSCSETCCSTRSSG